MLLLGMDRCCDKCPADRRICNDCIDLNLAYQGVENVYMDSARCYLCGMCDFHDRNCPHYILANLLALGEAQGK